jgi:DNA repair protein RadD
MILRPRQTEFKGKCVRALRSRRNTLGVAPTGAGKTVMLSAVAGELLSAKEGGRSLILQHRTELVGQNEKTFRRVNPGIKTSFFTADYKRWSDATFSMIQTLSRGNNLATMPAMDVIAIDEAHHAASDSYLKVIEHAKAINPDVMIFGVTATPGRGDCRSLRSTFDNVADQITIGELISAGNLVPPRCLVIETGTREELKGVRKNATDFDMAEVEAIMNKRVINDAVVRKWKEHAGDRLTVVFAATVQHARDVMQEFIVQGVSCGLIHGEMPEGERKRALADFDARRFQVLVNVMVLTEGWDCQPVSCVVLLRPCSAKGTMMQMIGRGLRTVDPERYPGVHKDDCIVLDFGYSLHTHRDLEQAPNIADEKAIRCPACAAKVPGWVSDCPICGAEIPRPEMEPVETGNGRDEDAVTPLADFVMTEIELVKRSPFKWEEFFDGLVTVANGLDAWVAVINYRSRWVAVGGSNESGMSVIADNGDRLLAMACADDFMRQYGDTDAARKSKRWVNAKPSDKQLQYLGVPPMTAMNMSRYRASCAITWKKMERAIKARVMKVAA